VRVVPVVRLDDLFSSSAAGAACEDEACELALAQLPRHPHSGARLRPDDVAVMKIDAEGHDLRVAEGARSLLAPLAGAAGAAGGASGAGGGGGGGGGVEMFVIELFPLGEESTGACDAWAFAQ
jgi:hypothetical protein